MIDDKDETLLKDMISGLTSTISNINTMHSPYSTINDNMSSFAFKMKDEFMKATSTLDMLKDFLKDIPDMPQKKKLATYHEAEIIAERIEEYGREYILEHYDKYDIQEKGSFIYQKVSDKLHDYLSKLLLEEYDFDDEVIYESLADDIFDSINFSSIWEVIDDIIQAPVTMEDKLKDVGMSEKDFLA